jgi:pimeloyl-ACP methyl ester carboxylesterase
VLVTPELRHIEGFTVEGLLTFLWHGDPGAERVVLMCGGAMGGLLGPANGLYHDLGVGFASDGIGTIRVGYRRPNDLPACVLDVAAAADLAHRNGGRRFVIVGHSFGGAVAINAGSMLRPMVAGVVTLSTQSAGCERAAALARPLLLLHGDRDELLPMMASQAVQALAGDGELEVLAGAGHLLVEAADHLRTRLRTWVPETFARPLTDAGPEEARG